MASEHIVKQGEHLSRIAEAHGFADFRIIWEHPNNAALKSKRKNPHVLFPGDKLFIPDKAEKNEALPTTKLHRFQITLPKLMLRMCIKDFGDEPMASTKCELEVEGTVHRLTTDAKGMLKQDIQRKAENGSLGIRDDEIPVKIGHLDPVEEPSGQQARLMNLGYYRGPLEPVDERELRSATEEFQCDNDLRPVTGVCDAKTQAKLKEVHGS